LEDKNKVVRGRPLVFIDSEKRKGKMSTNWGRKSSDSENKITAWLTMMKVLNRYMLAVVSFVGCCHAWGGIIELPTSCWSI